MRSRCSRISACSDFLPVSRSRLSARDHKFPYDLLHLVVWQAETCRDRRRRSSSEELDKATVRSIIGQNHRIRRQSIRTTVLHTTKRSSDSDCQLETLIPTELKQKW